MSRINNKQLVLRAFSFFCSGIFIGTIGILSWILGCCYPNSVMMIKKNILLYLGNFICFSHCWFFPFVSFLSELYKKEMKRII